MADNTESLRARKQRIQAMFNAIARRYDLLNHLLSGGIDIYWRRRALAEVSKRPGDVLDLATGTGDFALAAANLSPQHIVGVDVAVNMIRHATGKFARTPTAARVSLLGGDAERLPFRDRCFDLVTVAFGVRNFGSIPAGLAEAERVLRAGGELVVLDFTEPTLPVFSQVYRFYFHRVLPLIGGIISGNRRAYSYLPHSVALFPQRQRFLALMREAGFARPQAKSLTLGICGIYSGSKPN